MSNALFAIQEHRSEVATRLEESLDTGGEKMGFDQWQDIALEVFDEPNWRREADKCADYYDGNQLDASVLQTMKERGIAPLMYNMVQPVVNVALGMEARNRTDWRVDTDGDGDRWTDVATALNEQLHEAERKSRADRACSDAYAGQIKAGLAWVGVTRESNPYEYRYRVESVHRREIFWDWTDLSPDLRNAQWMVRQQWFEASALERMLPKQKSLIHYASTGWDTMRDFDIQLLESTGLAREFDQSRRFVIPDLEWRWRTGSRHRIRIFEVWYRKWIRKPVMVLPDGKMVTVDRKRFDHMQAIAAGIVQVQMAVYPEMRMALWMGPHRLLDVESPYQENRFPYIPWWGYREDLTGVPYGLIRMMLSPQDEVNARRSKMMWLLSAKRLIADSDALDKQANSVDQVLDQLTKPNAAIWLNPGRANRDVNAFRVEQDFALSNEQMRMYEDAKQMINSTSGVYQQMLGDARGGAKAGIAIDQLLQQGITTLAEINDNAVFARRQVGEHLLWLIKQDLLERKNVPIQIGRGKARRTIVLNQVVQDPKTRQTKIENQVSIAQVKVALEDVPSSSTQRAQDFTSLAELIKGLQPNIQAALTPALIESSSLRDRQKHADNVRKILGLPEELPPDQAEQAQEAMQAQQEEQAAVQKRAVMADVATKEAEARLKDATAQKVLADIRAAEAELANVAGAADGTDDPRLVQLAEQVKQAEAKYFETVQQFRQRETQLVGEVERERMRIAAIENRDMQLAEIEKAQSRVNDQRGKDESQMTAALKEVAQAVAALRADIEKRGERGESSEHEPAKPAPVIEHLHVNIDARKQPTNKRVTITDPEGQTYDIASESAPATEEPQQ